MLHFQIVMIFSPPKLDNVWRDWIEYVRKTDLDSKTSYPKPTSGAASLSSNNINSHRVTSMVALNASDIASITNLPAQIKGVLRTTVAGAYCTQEYLTDAKLYIRMYNGSAWSSWT